MALTWSGFDGGLAESEWALINAHNGAEYAIHGSDDFKVTTNTGGLLTVNVATGSAYGYGVKVANSASISIALDAIGSGTRWDAIVIRRTWTGTGGTVTVEKITGTATRAIPAGRLATPGTSDDQLLALVQVTAGSSLPTTIVDLRWRTAPLITVDDLLGIPSPRIGMEAVVAGVRQRYNGAAWVSEYSTVVALPLATNWVAYGGIYQVPQYRVANGQVRLRGLAKTTPARAAATHAIATVSTSIAPTLNAIYTAETSAVWTTTTVSSHAHNLGTSSPCRVDIGSNGNISVIVAPQQAIPALGWVSLDGISWDIGGI
jgi:hypothetical protein